MNGGFLEIMSLGLNKTSLKTIDFARLNFDCIVMHDVDLVSFLDFIFKFHFKNNFELKIF
jgi:hypothetical protein